MTVESPQLLLACIAAAVAVFVLLTALALVMRALIAVFPDRTARTDPAVLAAVTAVLTAAYPGMRITKVEEER